MLSTLKQYFCLSQPCLLCTLCIKYANKVYNQYKSIPFPSGLSTSLFIWLASFQLNYVGFTVLTYFLTTC